SVAISTIGRQRSRAWADRRSRSRLLRVRTSCVFGLGVVRFTCALAFAQHPTRMGVGANDRTNMLAVDGARQISTLQPVNDLDVSHMGGALHVVEHDAFDSEIVGVHVAQSAGADLRDK